MSTTARRIEYWETIGASVHRVVQALDSLKLDDTPRASPPPHDPLLQDIVRHARINPLTIDLGPDFCFMGVATSTAELWANNFQTIIGRLHESATRDLRSTCDNILSNNSTSHNRNIGAVIQRLIDASQHTYELRVHEVKDQILRDTQERLAHPSTSEESRKKTNSAISDDESEGGDGRIDDPDSDSDEAVNIERYYPVLEEMFLNGVIRPSRDEKLKLSEHTGIPYYNLGIWFQNRRDRGPHAGKGEWMRKYTESRSLTPGSYVSAIDGAETDDSVSDHGMSEFDEDEWETDPEDVPDLNLLEMGSAFPPLAFPTVPLVSPSCPPPSIPNVSESDSTPPTPFASSSRSTSSSDSFSYSDVSFVSAGPSMYGGSPSPLLEPGALLPEFISHARIPSESQTHESLVAFGQLPTPTPSMSFSTSISPSLSASLAQFGASPHMRGNTPSTAPSTPDEGPSTPPASSFGFDFGLTVPFGNSSRPNIPLTNLGLSPAVNDASPLQGTPQTPLRTFRSLNFEFSLTPSPTQGKFSDVDLSFGSFDIAPYSSAASFFDSFKANTDTPPSSDSPPDYASPNPPFGAASPPLPQSILLDFAGVNENNWGPDPTPEPSESGWREDMVESKLIAAAALVASRNPDQQPHNPSPFKLAPHHAVSRPDSPLMEPLFPLSSPLRDPSPIPSPTSPVMGMLPFLTHALRPPTRVDELATYANLRVEKSPLAIPLDAERENLDEPSPLVLTRHLEPEPEPTLRLSLFDVLKEPPVPVVDKATRDRVNDFLERYCAGRNGSSNETQPGLPSFPLTPCLPTASTSTAVP